MSKKVKVLVPEYYKKFQCIGSECPDTCCKNWTIYIDKASYKRFKNSPDLALNIVKDKNVKLNPDRRGARSYAELQLVENEFLSALEIDGADHRYCPYLSRDKLCRLYIEVGEEVMPDICRLYPRIINIIDGEYEMALTLSCPEAARFALEGREPMAFEHIEMEVDKYHQRIANTMKTQGDFVLEEFWNIRVASIRILQNRKFDIPTRLVLLGMLYQRIQREIDEKKYHKIGSEIVRFMENVDQADSEILNHLEKDRIAQLLSMKLIISEQAVPRKHPGRFDKMLDDAWRLLANSDSDYSNQSNQDITVSYETLERFERLNQFKIMPFIRHEEIKVMFEHYLVNTFFHRFLPFGIDREIFVSIKYLASSYFILKILLSGVFFVKDEVTKNDLVEIMYLYTKCMMQNQVYEDFVKSAMSYLNMDTLGGIYTLLFD